MIDDATFLASLKIFLTRKAPTSKIPFGILAPMQVYFSGSFKKFTTSESCSLSSLIPATSENLTSVVSALNLKLPAPVAFLIIKDIYPIIRIELMREKVAPKVPLEEFPSIEISILFPSNCC